MQRRRISCLLLGWLTLQTVAGWSQAKTTSPAIVARGTFLTDTIKIGYPFQYAFSVRHSPDTTLVFPDSTYDFAPFEWIGKAYFPTRTDESGSVDSVVYTLRSFSVGDVQTIRLPVFAVHDADCTAVFAKTDSVRLRQYITSSTDTTRLRINTAYVRVHRHVNVVGWLVWIGILTIITAVVYVLFGQPIRSQLQLYQMRREHAHFNQRFEEQMQEMAQNRSAASVERLVTAWKRYMESLENKPYRTYTTKEINAEMPNRALADALQTTDRVIYGHVVPTNLIPSTRVLSDVAHHTYAEQKTRLEQQRDSWKQWRVRLPRRTFKFVNR